MKELNKEQVDKLLNCLERRIENCRRRAKTYALEGNAQTSMVASIQEAEINNVLNYIHALMQDDEEEG